jgi:hypothetical protein
MGDLQTGLIVAAPWAHFMGAADVAALFGEPADWLIGTAFAIAGNLSWKSPGNCCSSCVAALSLVLAKTIARSSSRCRALCRARQ